MLRSAEQYDTMTLTLKLVLRAAALQQWEVTHNVLQLHSVQRPWRCIHLQRGRVAFDEPQACRETKWNVTNILCTAANVSRQPAGWGCPTSVKQLNWSTMGGVQLTKGQTNKSSGSSLISHLLCSHRQPLSQYSTEWNRRMAVQWMPQLPQTDLSPK